MTPDESRSRHDRIGELFLAAGRLPREERAAFLDGACGDDEGLREEVESLLAEDDAGLEALAGAAIVREARELDGAGAEAQPDTIGGYRILRRIGAGGMGIVYEAEQAEPSRRVALKVIRPGFVNEATLRRFRYEAQVLGWLDHPGIARVYEAGTEDGSHGPQPWFAMELVAGEPLNRWVERQDLGVRARLELLAQVCDAVHHAHQKGVIHRDLKPANVLVDAAGQPKVLDFGVARVTEHDLGTSTLQTLEGELIGTLPYMSPEQIEADPSKLDVRSDVYALGVVAYELLGGRLPHDLEAKRIAAAARTIVEDEPSTLGSLDPRLRGDIETIVAKAIEKDITRRYASAEELASDIRRHLGDEPIQARPPSAIYQLGKFARRNRGLVGGVVALFVVLVAATGVSWKLLLDTRDALGVAEAATGEANAAREDEKRQRELAENATAAANEAREDEKAQRELAEANLARAADAEALARENAAVARTEAAAAKALNDFLLSIFLQASPEADEPNLTVRDLLDRAADSIADSFHDRPRQRADIVGVIGVVYDMLGEHQKALPYLEESARLMRGIEDPDGTTADFLGVALARLGALYLQLGRMHDAVDLFDEALAIGLEPVGREAEPVLQAMRGLARALVQTGEHERGEALARETLAMAEAIPEIDEDFRMITRQVIASGLAKQERYDESLAMLREIEATLEASGQGLSNNMALLMTSIADVGLRMGDLEIAEEAFRKGREITEAVDVPGGPPPWIFRAGRGRVLLRRGDFETAGPEFEAAIAAKRADGMDRHPYMATSCALLADVRIQQGRPGEALDLLREALVITEDALARDHPDRGRIFNQVLKALRIGLDDPAFEPALERFRTTMTERGHAGELAELERMARE